MESTELQVFTIAKEYYEKEFTRAVLVELARKTNGAIDLSKVEFGSVTSRAIEIAVCEVLTACDYSYEAGTVREETYEDPNVSLENEDDVINETITKVRTYTDYEYKTGNKEKKYGFLCYNTEDASLDADRDVLLKVLKGFHKESVLEHGYSTISNDLIHRFEAQSKSYLENDLDYCSEIIRNVRKDSTTELKKLECYRMPKYEVEYMYEGNTYVASGFASGALIVDADVPTIAEKRMPSVKLKFTFPSVLTIAAWAGWLVVVIAAFVLIGKNVFYGWLAVLVASVGAAAFHYMQNRAKGAASTSKPKKTQRMVALNQELAKRGFDTLSEEEKETLDLTDKNTFQPKGNTTSLVVMGVVCILVLGILIPKSLKAQQHYNDTKFNVYGVTEQVALENTEGMESYNFNDAKVVEFVQNYLAPKFVEIHANDIGQQLMTYVDVRSEKSMHIYYACTVKSNDEMIEDVISYDWEITLEAVSNDGTLQINYKEPRNYKTFNAELVSKSLVVREDTDKDAAKVDTLKKGNIATISAYCNDGETQWFKVGENQWVVYNGENLVMSAQVKQ